MARLLVVHHSPTRSTQALLESALAGAQDDAIEGVEVVVRPALEATADDVLAADGYLLGSPVNFGYMSGALKHFFDSTFLAVGGALDPSGGAGRRRRARPRGGRTASGCTGATTSPAGCGRCSRSSARSAGGRRTTCSRCSGTSGEEERSAAYELGATIAALLSTLTDGTLDTRGTAMTHGRARRCRARTRRRRPDRLLVGAAGRERRSRSRWTRPRSPSWARAGC